MTVMDERTVRYYDCPQCKIIFRANSQVIGEALIQTHEEQTGHFPAEIPKGKLQQYLAFCKKVDRNV